MSVALVYALIVVGIGFAGATFHELAEQTEADSRPRFFLKVLYRTASWFWLGVAAILLSVAFRLP